jgi:hypothetical protein
MTRDLKAVHEGNNLEAARVVDIHNCAPCECLKQLAHVYSHSPAVQTRILSLWNLQQSVWNGFFREQDGRVVFNWLRENPERWTVHQSAEWLEGCMLSEVPRSWDDIDTKLLMKEIQYSSDMTGVKVFARAGKEWSPVDSSSPGIHNTLSIISDCIEGKVKSSKYFRWEVLEKPLSPGGPWRRRFGPEVPFPVWISKRQPFSIVRNDVTKLLVSFIPARTVGDICVPEAAYRRSFHFLGEAVWFRWPLNSCNRTILESHRKMEGSEGSITFFWACSNLEGLDVVVGRKGDVVQMDCATICGVITITDSLFVLDPYVCADMGDEFRVNMGWMAGRQKMTEDIPSTDDLDTLLSFLTLLPYDSAGRL